MTPSDRVDRIGRKGVVGILFALFIIIIILVAIIIMYKFFISKPVLERLDFDELAKYSDLATEKCDVLRRVYISGVLDSEDIAAQYEEELNSEDNNFYKVGLATCYAEIMYDKTGNIENAVKVVESVEPLIDSYESQIRYYASLMTIYNQAGDTDKSEQYKHKLSELTTDDVEEEEEEENESEEGEETIL